MSVACGGQISEPAGFLPEFLGLRPYPQASKGLASSQWDRHTLHKGRSDYLLSASLIHHEVICFPLMFPSLVGPEPQDGLGPLEKSSPTPAFIPAPTSTPG